MKAPAYTTCVDRKQYKNPDFSFELAAALFVAAMAGPLNPISLAFDLYLAIEVAMKVCEYLLHGKLVCLGGNECAIGHVTSFETVDDKEGFEKIDNDFCINVLPAPWGLESFTHDTFEHNYQKVVDDGMQGNLIREQAGMPTPREAHAGKKYSPYSTTYPSKNYIDYDTPSWMQGIPFEVPVLHTEIEGERIRAVCAALHGPLGLIPGMEKFCRWKPAGIPVGRWVCAALATLFAPLLLITLPLAWLLGADDNRDFRNAGSLKRGDFIVVYGRWVYDAGHAGYNELHPLLGLQKAPEPAAGLSDPQKFAQFRQRWCSLVSETPVPGFSGHHTPKQEKVYQAQLRPENRWYLHPEIDGCEPDKKPPVVK
ncbi:MAG: hypothetical protein L6Q97_12535 [Thermoanaerobaculia bacterium]|nr:hypothetical protein [Thermoanaerobaculia bacterium]